MRILICDDDPVFCDELERDLEQYEIIHRLEFEILKVFSGEQALDALAQGDWDVLFMDIEMPTINGVEAGKRVREQLQNYSLKIIYVSSRQEYAMDLFKVDTFDFLIKPVAYEELEAVLDKLQKTLDRNGEMFVYRKKGQAVRCRLEDILYFESWLKKTIIENDIKAVVAEDVNVSKNFVSLRKLSELRGVLLYVCADLDIPVVFVNVTSLKKWATGNGKADKTMMMEYCEKRWHYVCQDDNEADACHIYFYFLTRYKL